MAELLQPLTYGLLAILAVAAVISRVRDPMTIAWRIGIVGMPRAGKTSLIGALFQTLFESDANSRARLSGQKTIRKVHNTIASLKEGRTIAPTTEGEKFSYRFMFRPAGLLRALGIVREVEIADFPGEYSKDLIESIDPECHIDREKIFLIDHQYLEWMVSSRLILFVVDASELIGPGAQAAKARRAAEIAATWHALLDQRSKARRWRRMRAALVFTKCDAVLPNYSPDNMHREITDDEQAFIDNFGKTCRRDFAVPIKALEDAASEASVHFTSAYAERHGQCVGLAGLLARVLP